MKHINTTHELEANAKKEYTEVSGFKAVASEGAEDIAKKLLAVLKEIDDKELEASMLRGQLMEEMKGNDVLTTKDGKIICTWRVGNSSKSVDYAGIMKKYNVSEDDIEAFTKVKKGGRRFSLEMED